MAHWLPLAFITEQVTKQSWPLFQRGLSWNLGPWVETETLSGEQAVLSSPQCKSISSCRLSSAHTDAWLLLKKGCCLCFCVFSSMKSPRHIKLTSHQCVMHACFTGILAMCFVTVKKTFLSRQGQVVHLVHSLKLLAIDFKVAILLQYKNECGFRSGQANSKVIWKY